MVDNRPSPFNDIRDIVLFSLGVVAAVHELFFTDFDKPYRLALIGTLLGLLVYMRGNGRPPS